MNTLLNFSRLHSWIKKHYRKLVFWTICPVEITLMLGMFIPSIMLASALNPKDINWAVWLLYAIVAVGILMVGWIIKVQHNWSLRDPEIDQKTPADY